MSVAGVRQTLGLVFIDYTPGNTPLYREMEVRPFYMVCLPPIGFIECLKQCILERSM